MTCTPPVHNLQCDPKDNRQRLLSTVLSGLFVVQTGSCLAFSPQGIERLTADHAV